LMLTASASPGARDGGGRSARRTSRRLYRRGSGLRGLMRRSHVARVPFVPAMSSAARRARSSQHRPMAARAGTHDHDGHRKQQLWVRASTGPTLVTYTAHRAAIATMRQEDPIAQGPARIAIRAAVRRARRRPVRRGCAWSRRSKEARAKPNMSTDRRSVPTACSCRQDSRRRRRHTRHTHGVGRRRSQDDEAPSLTRHGSEAIHGIAPVVQGRFHDET